MTGGGNNFKIYDPTPIKSFPVAELMLKALKAGHKADTVWGVGCRYADMINSSTESDIERPFISCANNDPNHSEELHFCPDCLELKPHDDLRQLPGFYPYATCSQCNDAFTLGARDIKIKGGSVGYHMYLTFRRENEVAELNQTTAQIKQQQNETWSSLPNFGINANSFRCGYIEQELNTQGTRDRAWDGTHLNPLYPSIEAIDPVTRGVNGRSGYHTKNNIMIVSDSINRAKRHYPPVTLHGIKILVDAYANRDMAAYENGIAHFRLFVNNHYAYGDFAMSQQYRRVNKPLPENMDEILESFRTPILIKHDKSPMQVYRFLSSRQSIDPTQRRQWRHPASQWLDFQLKCIADTVFGDDATELEPSYLRIDSTGRKVFFPFSRYSVVDDWTHWDLNEFLQVRGLRNVTECQAPHSRTKPLPRYSNEELFLTIANLWIRMVHRDYQKGIPVLACGTDEANLAPQPTICSVICASIGHRWPGQYEHTGLGPINTKDFSPVTFNPDTCGMLWETQFTNALKFKYAYTTIPQTVLPQLQNIRLQNQIHRNPRYVLPNTITILSLKNELADPFKNHSHSSQKPLNTPAAKPQDDFALAYELSQFTKAYREEFKDKFEQELDEEGDTIFEDLKIEDVKHESTPTKTFDQKLDEEGDTMFDSQSLEDFSTDQPVPQHCNLKNIGATCYMSSVVQILANIPELHECFLQDRKIIDPSGRSPYVLSKDSQGIKHNQLYACFRDLVNLVTSHSDQLHRSITSELVMSCHDLSSQWKNRKNDAAAFLDWTMQAVNNVLDDSPPLLKEDVWEKLDSGLHKKRHAYSQEEVLNFEHKLAVSQSSDIDSLLVHVSNHWNAHLASGYDSLLTRMASVQIVDFYECNNTNCPAIFRDIHYDNKLIFRLDKSTTDRKVKISMSELSDGQFEEYYSDPSQSIDNSDVKQSQARTCSHQCHSTNFGKGFLTRRTSRITKMPAILAVELNRDTGFEDEIYENRITDFRDVDLFKWTNDGPKINEKVLNGVRNATHEHLNISSLEARYTVVGIIAFSRSAAHYTAFICSDNAWMYFNDMTEHPVYRDPFSQWPAGYVESVLIYRDAGQTAKANITEVKEGMTNARAVAPIVNYETKLKPNIIDAPIYLSALKSLLLLFPFARPIAERNPCYSVMENLLSKWQQGTLTDEDNTDVFPPPDPRIEQESQHQESVQTVSVPARSDSSTATPVPWTSSANLLTDKKVKRRSSQELLTDFLKKAGDGVSSVRDKTRSLLKGRRRDSHGDEGSIGKKAKLMEQNDDVVDNKQSLTQGDLTQRTVVRTTPNWQQVFEPRSTSTLNPILSTPSTTNLTRSSHQGQKPARPKRDDSKSRDRK